MHMIKEILRTTGNPLKLSAQLLARIKPTFCWSHYNRLAHLAGFKKLFFILSFDCDTKEDSDNVLDLDRRLRDMNLKPSYAVPGKLLEKSEKIYGKLLERNAEFINHGFTEHTFWNTNKSRYESCFFYNKLNKERVRKDIKEGHTALQKVFGYTPEGFRAPHFGTFQKKKQLLFVHSVIKELGYKFSSSTLPYYGFRYGPLFRNFGLTEIPISGILSRPLDIYDSWGYYASPNRRFGPVDYRTEAEKMARFCKESKMIGILNYYADPSHVWNQPSFFMAINILKKVAEPTSFSELLEGSLT